MNMHGVFLHVLADALGSVIVVISACIIAFTNWEYSEYVDPGLSVVMVLIIMRSTWPLRKQCILIKSYFLSILKRDILKWDFL